MCTVRTYISGMFYVVDFHPRDVSEKIHIIIIFVPRPGWGLGVVHAATALSTQRAVASLLNLLKLNRYQEAGFFTVQ